MEYEADLLLYKEYYYSVGLISLFGLIGNIYYAFLIRRPDRREPWSVILFGLILFDSAILVTYILNAILFCLHTNRAVDTQGLYLFLGLPLLAINKTAYMGSVYTTILFIVEEYFVICRPLNPEKWVTSKGAAFSLGLLFQIAICLNIPRWLEYNLGYGSDTYILYYHGWFLLMVGIAFPFIVIGILTYQIMRQVPLTSACPQGIVKEELPNTSFTKMIGILVGVFVVTNALYALAIIHFTIGKIYPPIVAELVACAPLALDSSVKSIIFCTSVSEVRDTFIRRMKSSQICGGSGTLSDPADCSVTILDSKKVELVSFKFNSKFDDSHEKYVINKNSKT